MNQESIKIILITGAPGSGKTTIAEELCKTFNKTMHIPVDTFRHMIKTGYVSPKNWNEEVDKQYKLARRNAADVAKNSASEGFTVVIDDIIRQKWVDEWKQNLKGYSLTFILLNSTLEETKKRNKGRIVWTVPENVIESLYELLSKENTPENGWIVIDNTHQTIDGTVQEIIKYLNI